MWKLMKTQDTDIENKIFFDLYEEKKVLDRSMKERKNIEK